MKKFAKFTISSLANIFVNICFKFRAGRYLLEKFYKNIAEHVQTVEHKRVQLKFYIPNAESNETIKHSYCGRLFSHSF